MNKFGDSARVLIIEDERIIAWDIKNQLESLGYTITGNFATSEEALLQISKNLPDLVLMDIGLKGDLNGLEAAALIRDQFGIPVVFLTGFADSETIKKVINTRAGGLITKPFQNNDLYQTINYALSMDSGTELSL